MWRKRLGHLSANQQLIKAVIWQKKRTSGHYHIEEAANEKFLNQALEVVEKELGNPDFSVEDFSRDMFMNRVTLYRKIVSITGKTPLEFIRSLLMKRAARLLEKSGMSVSEIAYEVGFNNPKIFSKFFKEEFNVLPLQYASQQKKSEE